VPTLYCTDEEVADVLPEYDPDDATEAASMARIRARVSRRIDRYLGTPTYGSEWFPEVGASGTRVFYGSGTPFLQISPHTGVAIVAAAVSIPSGYTLPDFVERDGHLVTTDASGIFYPDAIFGPWGGAAVWPYGVPVTVTSTWGYAAAVSGTSGVPGDVVEAAVLLCVAAWRQRTADPDVGGDVGKSFAMPAEARRILDDLRSRFSYRGAA
jgi:hypothetical protein